MLFDFTLNALREGFIDIASQAREAIATSRISGGIAVVYCPHTAAASP
ncbi:MAG: hypothetical protein LBI87_09480 [Candidatus Accumulibacter sp.]|jgi:thiamine phosphate synthase YjbQ (UPF0047 family)|nr:hypothetical protein [Accumulibacter sp.]